jgi:hypothetical protein
VRCLQQHWYVTGLQEQTIQGYLNLPLRLLCRDEEEITLYSFFLYKNEIIIDEWKREKRTCSKKIFIYKQFLYTRQPQKEN